MPQLNRRGFLSALAGLPFVGGLFGRKAHPKGLSDETPRTDNIISSIWMLDTSMPEVEFRPATPEELLGIHRNELLDDLTFREVD